MIVNKPVFITDRFVLLDTFILILYDILKDRKKSKIKKGALMRIKLKKLAAELPTPAYAYDSDAGCDLYSRVDLLINPGERKLIPTGIALEIPPGYAGFIQPRSGLALERGIGIVNSPGLIDSGYRGEVAVILINLDRGKSFKVKKGDKVCQLVIQKVETPDIKVVEELDNTERGPAGWGSTG